MGNSKTFASNSRKHTLKLFYLERGNDRSNLSLYFNLQSYPGLTVAKNVEGANSALLGDPYYEFTLSLSDKGTPSGIGAYFCEIYERDPENDPDPKIAVYDTSTETPAFKKLSDKYTGNDAYFNPADDTLHFYLTSNQYAVFRLVPENTQYALDEVVQNGDYNSPKWKVIDHSTQNRSVPEEDQSSLIPPTEFLTSKTSIVECTNTPNKVSSLKIKKTVTGPDLPERDDVTEGESRDYFFEAEIQLKKENDPISLESVSYYVVSSTDENNIKYSGVVDKYGETYRVRLYRDCYTVIEGIPYDVTGTVKEVYDSICSCDQTTYAFEPKEANGAYTIDEIVIKNIYGVELPETGGNGIFFFYFTGGILLFGAVVSFAFLKGKAAGS